MSRFLLSLRVLCYNPRMNATLKITRIGNSAGVVLPKELLAHLGVQVGDALSVARTSRGLELSRPAADEADQLLAAREVMERRRMALKVLAEIMEEDREILSALAKS